TRSGCATPMGRAVRYEWLRRENPPRAMGKEIGRPEFAESARPGGGAVEAPGGVEAVWGGASPPQTARGLQPDEDALNRRGRLCLRVPHLQRGDRGSIVPAQRHRELANHVLPAVVRAGLVHDAAAAGNAAALDLHLLQYLPRVGVTQDHLPC